MRVFIGERKEYGRVYVHLYWVSSANNGYGYRIHTLFIGGHCKKLMVYEKRSAKKCKR